MHLVRVGWANALDSTCHERAADQRRIAPRTETIPEIASPQKSVTRIFAAAESLETKEPRKQASTRYGCGSPPRWGVGAEGWLGTVWHGQAPLPTQLGHASGPRNRQRGRLLGPVRLGAWLSWQAKIGGERGARPSLGRRWRERCGGVSPGAGPPGDHLHRRAYARLSLGKAAFC